MCHRQKITIFRNGLTLRILKSCTSSTEKYKASITIDVIVSEPYHLCQKTLLFGSRMETLKNQEVFSNLLATIDPTYVVSMPRGEVRRNRMHLRLRERRTQNSNNQIMTYSRLEQKSGHRTFSDSNLRKGDVTD